jgi:hypothetical protein
MQSWSFKNVKIFWGRTPDPPFFRKLSMTVEINQKKLYYNYYTSGKFLALKFKFQVKSYNTPQLQMLRYVPIYSDCFTL